MSKWYQNGVEGIKVLMRILVGQRTRPDHNLTIYDETKFSSCHTPYINSILHPASSYYFLNHKKLFQAGNFNVNVRPELLYFSIWGVYSKTYQKHNLWPMKTAKTKCAHHQGDLFDEYILRVELSWIVCLTSQLTIFQSYMWRHIDVQADWRRSMTYGRAPNAIDIS